MVVHPNDHMYDSDLLELDEIGMRLIRGKAISMIFQEPMISLNPVFTIGSQIVEAIRAHERISRAKARDSPEVKRRVVRARARAKVQTARAREVSRQVPRTVRTVNPLSRAPRAREVSRQAPRPVKPARRLRLRHKARARRARVQVARANLPAPGSAMTGARP